MCDSISTGGTATTFSLKQASDYYYHSLLSKGYMTAIQTLLTITNFHEDDEI